MGIVIPEQRSKVVLEPHEELWNATECAQYLTISRAYFLNKVSKRSDFPPCSPTGYRWSREKVVQWATG